MQRFFLAAPIRLIPAGPRMQQVRLAIWDGYLRRFLAEGTQVARMIGKLSLLLVCVAVAVRMACCLSCVSWTVADRAICQSHQDTSASLLQ